jgi:Flp pilus assembly secretin CpaC
MVAPSPVAAQGQPKPGTSQGTGELVPKVQLTAGRSTVVSTEFNVTRIAVTNPEVADAVVVHRDYKRFLNFLGTHECRVDFREFRGAASERVADAPLASILPVSQDHEWQAAPPPEWLSAGKSPLGEQRC